MPNLTGYKKFMSDSEIRLLLEFINKQSEQIKLIFHILIFMGLRVGEVVTLKRENLQGNKLVFPLEKSHRVHTRIVPSFLVKELYDYVNKHNIRDGFMFSTKYSYRYNGGHNHIQRSSIGWYVKMFREKHGLTDSYYTQKHGNKLYRISTHTIRHWHLTKLYEKSNHDVLLVADIIGHKKLETTFQYLRAWKKLQREEELVNAMAAI